jgi:hypothetical protein
MASDAGLRQRSGTFRVTPSRRRSCEGGAGPGRGQGGCTTGAIAPIARDRCGVRHGRDPVRGAMYVVSVPEPRPCGNGLRHPFGKWFRDATHRPLPSLESLPRCSAWVRLPPSSVSAPGSSHALAPPRRWRSTASTSTGRARPIRRQPGSPDASRQRVGLPKPQPVPTAAGKGETSARRGPRRRCGHPRVDGRGSGPTMHTSPHTRTRPRRRRWGHERWWSKPKSHDGERHLGAGRP